MKKRPAFTWPSLESLMLPVVLLLCFSSAIAVVWVKHHSRSLLNERQTLAQNIERLETEYNQLSLERGALGAHARIEQIARDKLGMVDPDDYTIVQISR